MTNDEYGILPDEFYQFRNQPIVDEQPKCSNRFFWKSKAAVKLISCVVSVTFLTAAAAGSPVFASRPGGSQEGTYAAATANAAQQNAPGLSESGGSAPQPLDIHKVTDSGDEKAEPSPAVGEERECPSCHGTGILCPGDPNFGIDRGNGNGYAGCGGTGYSKCPDIWCNNGIKTCQNCRGSGVDQDGDPDPFCGGSGIVNCEFCNNTGIAPCICASSHQGCDQCHGTGKVPDYLD